jgi:glycosyltransferase involved in cell wall biosynthesis
LGFRDDIYRILKSCDVMVLPSFLEGMPNVIFEGMIAKIPVVASDIPVHRRWIQHRHNGLLFDPRDAGSLAESIHEILTMAPETRVKLIWEAFKIGSEFNVAHMITSYEKLYSRLAPGGIQRLG